MPADCRATFMRLSDALAAQAGQTPRQRRPGPETGAVSGSGHN